ncbi:MAG: GNAT family N-acetyltransferase, partial [Bacteriovoracia bacterium]
EDDIRIGDLLVESFLYTYGRKMPEVVVTESRKSDLRAVAAKRETAGVLVAERDGELIGTVSIFRPGDATSRAWTPNTVDLRYMAVAPRHQGQGVSRALLDAAVALAREWQGSYICLHVRRGATGVARTYTSYGFGRQPEGDADLLPEIFLEAYLLKL